jgi:hypothetical protein
MMLWPFFLPGGPTIGEHQKSGLLGHWHASERADFIVLFDLILGRVHVLPSMCGVASEGPA